MVRRSASITRLDAIRWGQPDVSQHLFDSVTRYDVDGKLQGRLAESWELVDPTTWRFKLRQGVKFQNDEDWNAEALKYNVEMYSKLDPPWAYASYFQNAWPMSVEVESPTSALIKTPAPQPRTPRIMTRMNMVPPTASQDVDEGSPMAQLLLAVSQWPSAINRAYLDTLLAAFPEQDKDIPRQGHKEPKVPEHPIPPPRHRLAPHW